MHNITCPGQNFDILETMNLLQSLEKKVKRYTNTIIPKLFVITFQCWSNLPLVLKSITKMLGPNTLYKQHTKVCLTCVSSLSFTFCWIIWGVVF